jgi:hypothetical protein
MPQNPVSKTRAKRLSVEGYSTPKIDSRNKRITTDDGGAEQLVPPFEQDKILFV